MCSKPYLPEQKPERQKADLYAEAITLSIFTVSLIVVYVAAGAAAITIYWQKTADDRQELFRITGDWLNGIIAKASQTKEQFNEAIEQITDRIFNLLKEKVAWLRGLIDTHSESIRDNIRGKVRTILESIVGKPTQPTETTPTIPPTTSDNPTVPAPPVPQTSPRVREPAVSDLSVPVSPIATTLSDLEQRIAQIDLEQRQLLQDVNANIERINTGITQIQEEWKQRLRDFNAKIDSINRQLDQLEDRREQERLAAETERLRQQQRDLDLEIAKADIANDSHNELWRQRLADVDENEREEVIREAAALYNLYNQSHPDEIIDIKNPNPQNVVLWSNIIAQVISDREPGNEQFGFAKPSALTPRSGGSSPERLGGFGEGESPQVDSHTGHGPQEKLPPLGGFGDGERLEVDNHTGHTPQEKLPDLGGFEQDPQLNLDDLTVLTSRRNQPGNQPTGAEIRQQITKIASRYKIFKCVECAAAIKKFLIKQGIHGTHIKVDTGSSDGYMGIIYHLVVQEQIALNGHHEGIVVVIDGQELVFDNIDHEGVPKEVWLQNLYSPIMDMGEKFQIVETDF